MTTHRIDVRIPGREYPVLIGHGISQEIGQWLPTTARRACRKPGLSPPRCRRPPAAAPNRRGGRMEFDDAAKCVGGG